jgi:chromosome segregation ATPase
MPKKQKQKKSIRKRTPAKKKGKRKRKRKYGIDVVDDNAITALDMLQTQAESFTEELEDFADASEERASIISTVKGLEGQVETVFKLNEILEAQLDAAQKKLSEELSSRVQSELQMSRRLEASEASKVAMEKKMTETFQESQALRDEVEELQVREEKLRDELASTDSRTAELRVQLEERQATNRKLMEASTRLEKELNMVNMNYDANKNELDAFKNAVRDIRSEASRTSGRVQQKFLQPKKRRAKSKASRKRRPSSTKKS